MGIGVPELFIILVVGIMPIALIIGVVVIVALRISQRGSSRHAREIRMRESRTIQDIFKGLSDMEKRIETLETLLLDRVGERKDA